MCHEVRERVPTDTHWGATVTTTTNAPITTDIDLIAALEASPEFTVVRDGNHLAELLAVQVPSADALAVLNDPALASGIERGIVAAGVLERVVPADVSIEEYTLGSSRTRGVFLHQDGVDQIALHFLDGTAQVAVHIDSDDPDEAHDGFVTPTEMFALIRAYYRA